MLAVHVHDAFRSSLHELARVLAEANLRLSDLELQELIDRIPDLSTGAAHVREVAAGQVTGQPAKPEIRTKRSASTSLRGSRRWHGHPS